MTGCSNVGVCDFYKRGILILGILSLAGCYSASLSRAYIEPDIGWTSDVAGRAQRISGKDVDIYVKTSNRSSKVHDETKADTFGISLLFIPKIDKSIKIVPSDVFLRIPNQFSNKPSRIEMMIAGNNSGINIWDCGPYKLESFEIGQQYVLQPGFCVNLYFNTRPPSADTEFYVLIPDLISKDIRIPIPELHFKKGDVKIYDFL